MEKICRNCAHWHIEDPDRYYEGWHLAEVEEPITGRTLTDEETRQFTGRVVKRCVQPLLKFYERPDINGLAVFDGSQYMAGLLTGEEFGCVNFEPKQ